MHNLFTNKGLIEVLKSGGVAVAPTDTIYGLIGSALDRGVVKRIYELKKRDPKKPLIVIVGDLSETKKVALELTSEQVRVVRESHPEATSFIIDCPNDAFAYLHRGTRGIAIRLPELKELRDLLIQTGPLIATSVNLEGLPHAKTIEEAKKYFGATVDFYLDAGEISSKPSKLVYLSKEGIISIMRA